MLISAAFDIAWPLLLQRAIDIYITQGNLPGLYRFSILVLLLVLISSIATSLRMRIVTKNGQSIIKSIRTVLFSHVNKLPVAFFDKMPVGKIMTRLTSDVDALARLFEAGIVSIIVDSMMLLGIIVSMFYLNTTLALLMLIELPILIFVTFVLRPIILKNEDDIREGTSKTNAAAQEIISGVRVIQAFNAEDYFGQKYDSENQALCDSAVKAVSIWSYYWPLVDLTFYIGLALVVWVGGNLAQSGTITVGTVLAFIIYTSKFFQPLRGLAQSSRIIQQAITGADRVVEVLETEVEEEGKIIMPLINGDVIFENITFGYISNEIVLQNFNLSVEQGQMIALVGHTGAGKTSVINLLCRFYDPQSGRILVDGVDIRESTLHSYRKQIGLVLQDPFLFSGTLRENMLRGNPEATDLMIVDALETVGLYEDGSSGFNLDTVLTERGQNLSFGERQLVSFARALLSNPRILILDEATAHVDTITELKIQKALRVLLKGRTSFVIAHRLSTIREADQIIVLGDGKILESGTHDELVKAKKEYYSLLQAANQ